MIIADFNKIFGSGGDLALYANGFQIGFFDSASQQFGVIAPEDVILEFVGVGEKDGKQLEFGFTKQSWLDAHIDIENAGVLIIEDIHGDTVCLEFERRALINPNDI